MRHFSIGARTSARQGLDWVSIAAFFAAFFAASTASAALNFDLRAVSGSQVTIHGPKSVGVTQNSAGGWIDFELHALVTGQNNSSSDEALHSFAGNIFSTHFGRGAVSGDLVNTGEIAPRVRRGIAAPFVHFGYSDGWAQNLDGDPDLEIGGTGESYWNHNTLVPTSTRGAIIGRGNPFNVYGYAGDGGVADFLLYRFTLPIASLLAGGLEDLTSIYFEPWNGSAAGHWREDGLGKSRINGGTVAVGESVLIHTAETPSDVASIPEPGAWLLGTTALAGLVFARRRRGVRFVAMPRSFSTFAWLATVSVLMGAGSANAALTFDLRAVSGSQVTIHNPKSVGVTQNSVGGWVDFELWGIVTGSNNTPFDDWVENFAGSMLSDHFGNGAVSGSMVNTGHVAPHARRGVVAPFDNAGYLDGWLQNLDNDPDLEIGGRIAYGLPGGLIAGRTGRDIYYFGSKPVAEFLLYRFMLPITGINAQTLTDITSIRFLRDAVPSFLWEEDDVPKDAGPISRDRGLLNVAPPVLIHTAQTPEELAAIPEPATWLLGALALVGFALTLRLRPTSFVVKKRPASIIVVLLSLLCSTAATARADLTYDLRAVSGSQIIIHGPKSVAVNQFSVGGWIDFELWAIVTGDNAIATDDGMQNFVGNMFSTHAGRGAAVGDMINAGELAPRMRRGVLAPFDGTAHQNGNVQNLDNDPELEIGGTQYPSVVGMIAARTGTGPAYYAGSEPTASFPLYRFTLPIESVPAESLADMTRVHFETPFNPVMYIWWEDGQSYYPAGADPGTMLVNDSVLIHTADTPEELALIPEPGTWALGLSGMVGAGWFARRRRRR